MVHFYYTFWFAKLSKEHTNRVVKVLVSAWYIFLLFSLFLRIIRSLWLIVSMSTISFSHVFSFIRYTWKGFVSHSFPTLLIDMSHVTLSLICKVSCNTINLTALPVVGSNLSMNINWAGGAPGTKKWKCWALQVYHRKCGGVLIEILILFFRGSSCRMRSVE